MALALAWQAAFFPAHAETVAPDVLAERIVKELMQELRLRHEEYSRDQSKLHRLVERRLTSHFDMNQISNKVLGKYWDGATAEQRQRFITAFKVLLIRQYSAALLSVDEDAFEWQPVVYSDDRRQADVSSSILRQDGPPLSVLYRLHQVNDDWRVYDFSIDGISLVTNYRGMFVHELRKNGLQALILRLEDKASS